MISCRLIQTTIITTFPNRPNDYPHRKLFDRKKGLNSILKYVYYSLCGIIFICIIVHGYRPNEPQLHNATSSKKPSHVARFIQTLSDGNLI